MRPWRVLLLLIVTAGVASAAGYIVRDTTDWDAPSSGKWVTFHSRVLNEEREYIVYLPEGYESRADRRYPVLYVLDGGSQAGSAAETAGLMARIGVIPPVIVIGVATDESSRNRDYTPPGMLTDIEDPASPTGSGDRFLRFLAHDLVDTVEREYRTTAPRMLSGWSRSGLFVVYSQVVEPGLFDARFAHSPALWREDDAILPPLKEALGESNPAGFLFLSLGDKENTKMTASFQRAQATLNEHAPSTLRWHAYTSPGGVHATNPRLALPVALCMLFRSGSSPTCSAQ